MSLPGASSPIFMCGPYYQPLSYSKQYERFKRSIEKIQNHRKATLSYQAVQNNYLLEIGTRMSFAEMLFKHGQEDKAREQMKAIQNLMKDIDETKWHESPSLLGRIDKINSIACQDG